MMKDGYLNKCKTCYKIDIKENRSKKSDYYKEFDRKRSMLPHRVEARKAYIKTDAGKIAKKRAMDTYKKKYPLKTIAVRAVNNHLKNNPDFRKPCFCGKKAQAHHPDYTKPLDVIWLCSSHHAEEHRRLKLTGNDPDINL